MLKNSRVLKVCTAVFLAATFMFSCNTPPAYALTVTDPETGETFTFYRDERTDMPAEFVDVLEVIPDAAIGLSYYGSDNFVGRPIDGYEANRAILTKSAAAALKKAADSLRKEGYGIYIFDAYRPQAALDHFARWVKDPADVVNQASHYPNLTKSQIVEEGYLAPRYCVHSRGSAVDLTLVDLKTGEKLDMGTDFDFFDVKSHHYSGQVTPEQAANRQVLLGAMSAAGFESLPEEWWHYKLFTGNEPFPETYFGFHIKEKPGTSSCLN